MRTVHCVANKSEEVHLWKASLDVGIFELLSFVRVLSDDEQDRANRFYLQKHKNHFVAARGILRHILSRYLMADPGQLRFKYGPHGKPALDHTGVLGTNLRFNISHSKGLLLVVVSVERELGIDLEQIQPALVTKEIVTEVFSEQEQTRFCSVQPAIQPKMFFEVWTRKEAYLKARGIGLSVPLNQLEVLQSGDLSIRLELHDDKASDWTIQSLDFGNEYSACLVVQGDGWTLKSFEYAIDDKNRLPL